MCGIIGIIRPDSEQYIKAATDRMAHRGPDAGQVYTHDALSLGHRRLSIVDLSENGNQPMFSADGRYVLVYNGEIYNHFDFLPALQEKYQFRSSSDTETLLYGLIEYGTDILPKLNGIFAFAFYDTLTHNLLIVRDHFGIKPLYYYQKGNTFCFGSELKSFEVLPDFDRSLRPEALVNYLHFGYSLADATPLALVKKLEGGHFLRLNTQEPQSFEIQKYYEIPFTGKYSEKTENELIDELEKRFYKAVERQLMADVPVGFFLSGGLDSSAVVAMARKITGKRLVCYTINSELEGKNLDGIVDDLYYARKVANYLDVELREVSGRLDTLQDFGPMVYHLDEPQSDPAALHVQNICRQARKDGFKVLLGGTAGDDLFSGYRRHQALSFEPFFKLMPTILAKGIEATLSGWNSQTPTLRRIKKVMAEASQPQMERLVAYFGWLPVPQIIDLFTEEYQHKIRNYQPSDTLIKSLDKIPDEKNLLNQMLFWEMKYFLTDHNLNYTDKMSMAESMEVRVPFLDIELVEFSTQIPPALKKKGRTVKYLLKKMMERHLPHEVIYRPKTGFGSPIREWIINDWERVNALYPLEKMVAESGVFQPQKVAKLLKDNREGRIDASYNILILIGIEVWLRKFGGL